MRIVLLTPGTGYFYCGSCLRDNALADALRELGHDTEVVPLYLPMVLETGEEHRGAIARPPSTVEPEVLMGGINLYLQHLSRVFRRVPRGLMNVLDRPSLLRWSSRRGNMTDASRLGPITLDTLRGDAGPIADEVTRLATRLMERARPDVVFLSNVMLIGVARAVKAALGCKVICTLQGEAPFLDALVEPHRAMAWEIVRERARDADQLVAVSGWYRDLMAARLDQDPASIAVAWNGIDTSDLAPPAAPPRIPTIGYLARMCRDKGLHTLVDAFLIVAKEMPEVCLRVGGVMLAEDYRPFVRDLRKKLQAAGLLNRAEFLPDLERAEKVRFLQSMTVLSVPATYGESFGLYQLEAMACGVPVVQPRHAAFPEVIEATGGGLLCAPDDPAALADALLSLLRDPDRARALGAKGRAAVAERFTAKHMATRVLAAIDAGS